MLKYQRIKQELRDKIIKMSPGEPFPTRLELMKEYGVARATVDKAISELCHDGFLSSRAGDGTYVSEHLRVMIDNVQNWGIIVPDVTASIYSGIVRGAENYAQKVRANIILCNSDNDLEKQEMYIERLNSSEVSGIIIVPVVSSNIQDSIDLYNQLIRTRIPFVFCNRSVEGIDVPLIASNDFYGAYLATKYLLKQGYRRPAFIAREKYKTSNDRCQGYLSALLEKGLEINRKAIIVELPVGSETQRISKLLEEEEIDSIFCFDDSIAEICYGVIKHKGLNIPNDIGIIGYNNTARCNSLNPPLSSVSFKNVEIGEKAGEVLYKLINNGLRGEFEIYIFQPTVEARESTAKMAE